MGDTMDLATLARDSALASGDTSDPEMVETSHHDSDSKIESSTSDRHELVFAVTTLIPMLLDSNTIFALLPVTANHGLAASGWARF